LPPMSFPRRRESSKRNGFRVKHGMTTIEWFVKSFQQQIFTVATFATKINKENKNETYFT